MSITTVYYHLFSYVLPTPRSAGLCSLSTLRNLVSKDRGAASLSMNRKNGGTPLYQDPPASSSSSTPIALPHPAEDLSADDDLLSWILVDQLGALPDTKLGVHPQQVKFVGPTFKTQEVMDIVREVGLIPFLCTALSQYTNCRRSSLATLTKQSGDCQSKSQIFLEERYQLSCRRWNLIASHLQSKTTDLQRERFVQYVTHALHQL